MIHPGHHKRWYFLVGISRLVRAAELKSSLGPDLWFFSARTMPTRVTDL